MRRLINAFAIEKAVVGECTCLCVATAYVQLMFGCLSVSFRTIKEKNKQVCFLLFIHNVQRRIKT